MAIADILNHATEIANSGTVKLKSSLEYKCDTLNATQGDLKYLDCPKCLNKGYYATIRDGELISVECPCMTKRRSWKRIESAGLNDVVRNYTFTAYEDEEDWQKQVKTMAIAFSQADEASWFFISGTPGTGKTHICTAITTNLIKRGYDAKYLLWREEIPKLKALVNEREQYEKIMGLLKRIDVLYIDDFWKGTITEADINLTFELLNARYNARNKRTIISTEKTMNEILGIDEAIGSRISERSKGYKLHLPKKNWRLKGQND